MNPGQWTLRWLETLRLPKVVANDLLVASDWFEEHGALHHARALRYMARHDRRVGVRERYRDRSGWVQNSQGLSPVVVRGHAVSQASGYCWLRKGYARVDKAIVENTCELPDALFVSLSQSHILRAHAYYPSWLLAFEDLVTAVGVLDGVLCLPGNTPTSRNTHL